MPSSSARRNGTFPLTKSNAPSSLVRYSCFHLDAYGQFGGPVSQLGDGQNRIGDESLPEGQYCIGQDGSLTDGAGRGCIWTPPTTQFQCDVGATPDAGFSVGGNGTLSFRGEVSMDFLKRQELLLNTHRPRFMHVPRE